MISVITPVFNAERFIEKAVASALIQKEVAQVVLIEDGSTDNSLRKCKKIVEESECKVQLYRHQGGENRGAGASRNLGISHSTQDYIAFLDADDYYLPNRFDNDLKILRENTEIDGVYNALGAHCYDDCEVPENELTTVKDWIDPEELFFKMAPMGQSGHFSGDTLTVRKTVFEKVGLFDTSLELSQDTHMWIKMAAVCRLQAGIIDRAVAIRGVHSGNRIKNREKLLRYRPLMFNSLLEWGAAQSISIEMRKCLWEKLYTFKRAVMFLDETNGVKRVVKTLSIKIRHYAQHPALVWNNLARKA